MPKIHYSLSLASSQEMAKYFYAEDTQINQKNNYAPNCLNTQYKPIKDRRFPAVDNQ